MHYWKHSILLLSLTALLCWCTTSTLAHNVGMGMNQQQVSSLYNKLTKLPSDQLVKMADYMTHQRQEYDSAVVCLSVVTNRYNDDMDLAEKAVCLKAFSASGYIYFIHYYDYDLAFDMLLKAREVGEKYLPNDKILCRTYLNCGNLLITSSLHYGSENLMKSSLDYFHKSLRFSFALKEWDMFTKAFIHLSTLYIRRNDAKALKGIISAQELDAVPSSSPNYHVLRCYYNAAQNYAKRDYPAARKCLGMAMGMDVKSNTPYRYKSLTCSSIAHIFEMEANLDSAMAYYNRALDIADKYNLVDVEAATYGFIANDYQMANDDENYIKYYKRYAEVKDSMLSFGGLENVSEKHFLHEVKQEADRADKLHLKNLYTIIFGLLILIIAIVLGVAVFLVKRKNKYLNERNQLLFERVHILMKKDSDGETECKKYQNSNLSEDEKQRLVKEINQVMQNEEVICQPTFSAEHLAGLIGTNYRYVSQVVNECYGKNFSTILAEKRVKIACRYFDDVEHYGNLTIEAVAQNVGFRSRNSLITAFKRVTGLTPSEYQKMSKNG